MSSENTKEISKEIVLEEAIAGAIKLPGAKVNRKAFLHEQFEASKIPINDIIELGPVSAGVTREELDNMSQKLILKGTAASSAASFLAGMPGGLAMAATIPLDVAQFFGMALRLAQQLSYLYGASDIWKDGKVDEERVRSQLIMYCGVMFGVSGAVSCVRVLSVQVAKTVAKKLPQKALTKTLWYPIVKQIGKALSIKVTKQTVANGLSKAVPVIGGVISGSLNFASMMPMAKRLAAVLDKSAFDYSREEMETDLDVMERMANGEIIMDDEPTKAEEIKDKVTSGIKAAGAKMSGLAGKLGKMREKGKQNDPIEELKKYKELLDMGIISQEEFNKKKAELLNL